MLKNELTDGAEYEGHPLSAPSTTRRGVWRQAKNVGNAAIAILDLGDGVDVAVWLDTLRAVESKPRDPYVRTDGLTEEAIAERMAVADANRKRRHAAGMES